VQRLEIDESKGKKESGSPKMKEIRLHGLRKYFRNNMKADGAFVNFWMGLSLGVDAHYISRDVEEHRRRYREGYPSLRLYEADPASIVNLYSENADLKRRIAATEEKLARIEKLLDELKEEN
jgi:hypothetical protein